MALTLLTTDDDLLRYEPDLERFYPRKDKTGKQIGSWQTFHELAVEEIDGNLRANKPVYDRFEWARLGERSKWDQFKRVASCYALYFLFNAANVQAENGFLQSKRDFYYDRATKLFEAECIQIDYDLNSDGKIDQSEQNRPMTYRFLRG